LKLRVNILSSGRFHVLDLARELDALGIVDVRFYSYVPRKRAEIFGLPKRCHVGFLPFLFPFIGLERLLPGLLPRLIERCTCWGLDLLAILRMRPCDVVICMSGIYLLAPKFAKRRYGALILLHRGSQHVLAQDEILSKVPNAKRPSAFTINRELKGYQIADRIVIASDHVAKTFELYSDLHKKLFKNVYGVALEQFPLRTVPSLSNKTILHVGHWSYRKGVDNLTYAIKEIPSARLIHVGSIVDIPFPDHPRFVHYDPVPQWRLKEFYSAAHVFAFPSREDGFGVVLTQALASGLRIVCTVALAARISLPCQG
jgi:glycosyltransferase involved in cell wall biosynthesis